MNALINSQENEIKKFEINYLLQFVPENDKHNFNPKQQNQRENDLDDILIKLRSYTGKKCPFTYGRYTGQEDAEARLKIEQDEPDIILTNYMMMELIMTRAREEWLRKSLAENLKYLVLDELHTYRGRQGSDVSLLIRRLKTHARQKIVCIGTSATMTTLGTLENKKNAVARVASVIFGESFNASQIIGEFLTNCTKSYGIPGKFELQEAIHSRITLTLPADQFIRHPLAVWLENNIALLRDDQNNEHLERGIPVTLKKIALKLAADSGESEKDCKRTLISLFEWSENLNIIANKNKTESFLPFKIHQFIAQTSTVYVTLEPKNSRKISIENGRYLKDQDQERFIYPVLFSRFSGHEFICVRKNFDKSTFEPRDPSDIPTQITKDDLTGDKEENRKKRILTEKDFSDGYLIIPDENDGELWSDDDIQELPESWWKIKKGKPTVDNYYQYRLPQKVYFDSAGNFSEEPDYDLYGWFMPVKLLFDPTAGLIYDMKTNEHTKLMRLGNEGRSTATTLLSYSVISELHFQGAGKAIQKLLSFTDNRQDASLQAGHFNDFINTGRLRSALYHALKKAQGNQLKVYELADRVSTQLNLKESDYARGEANDEWPDPERERALKKYLLIRLLYDLRRGWKYNMPNLEQAGLLTIEYERLTDFCKKDEFFAGILLFEKLEYEERKKIFVQLLNFFRTSYAMEYPAIGPERSETEEFIKSKLDHEKQWSLDKNERIEIPYVMTGRSAGETQKYVYTTSMGPSSYVGKYFRRKFKDHNLTSLKGNEFSDFIESVCDLLKKANLLSSTAVKGKNGVVKGYSLRVDNVIWKLGDGNSMVPDEIRLASYKTQKHIPNVFFRKFYQTDFTAFQKQFIGSEHTGQLNNEDRINREKDFREGALSALFCSPTMELGIDIADLNIVHMRNVPPNPSNYVQRSGRAGRSGQTAVVFNYCSNGSPHDRHYFKSPEKMVAGAVVPPNIDLMNEELILTHFNAFILMNLGLKQIHTSVADVIDLKDKEHLTVKADIIAYISNQEKFYRDAWITHFKEIISSIIPELLKTNWFNDNWLLTRANTFLQRFDATFNRWRVLYHSAVEIIQKARATMDDPTVKHGSPLMIEAKRQHNLGLVQKALLINESNKSFGNESEFYVFRYLASEGFLPGYNFTRLPIRAFVGYKYKDEGDYISRPRFVALREFGPNNLIYHNGNKFRISRMLLSDASLKMQKIKISRETGYAFLGEETEKFNNDPITNNSLSNQSQTEVWTNVLEITETEAIPQERISCEEEERTSTGFEIESYFSYPKGMESTLQTIIKESEQPLLRLIFCQATRLIQINHRWLRSKDKNGFLIDDRNGKWLKEKELENPEINEHAKEVRIFASDHADTLYIQPVKELGLRSDQVISLAYALKRACENLFEVEESEIGVWIMGKKDEPNIMLYEASEGSLGVLSQLIESPNKLKELFTKAYQLMHFDVITFTDTRPDLPKASYDDLLSYYNQRHHDHLDRYSIKEALERLIRCDISPTHENNDRKAQYEYLLEKYDKNSATELKLIRYLYQNEYALPDKAQVNIKECYVNADFVYNTSNGPVLVFCDGSVHDLENLVAEDDAKRSCLRDHGYDLIIWHYREPLEKLVERRKDVFRKL